MISYLLLSTMNIYTWYELFGLLIVLIPFLLASLFISYRITERRAISVLFVTQPVLFTIIFMMGNYVAEEIFAPVRNGFLQIGFIIGLTMIVLNMVIYSIEFVRAKKEKRFDPDRVNRRHFASTLNTIVLLTVLGASFGFFSPSPIGQVLIVTSVTTIITLLINLFLVRRFIRDESEK